MLVVQFTQELQKMDERRIQKTGQLLSEYSNLETKVMPIIQKCLDNIKGFGNSVNGPEVFDRCMFCLLYTSPSPRDA